MPGVHPATSTSATDPGYSMNMPEPEGCGSFPGAEYADVRAGQRIPAFSEYADLQTGRRPVRRPLRHAGMALRYLWVWLSCRRPVANLTIITSTVPISFPSPRNPASELSVAGGAVPKTCQKPPSPRGNGTEVPVGRVPVPKTCQKTPFATPRWL